MPIPTTQHALGEAFTNLSRIRAQLRSIEVELLSLERIESAGQTTDPYAEDVDAIDIRLDGVWRDLDGFLETVVMLPRRLTAVREIA